MKKVYYKKAVLFCLIWASIPLINFCLTNESYAREFKYEKIVELETPLTAGSSFEAKTHNGSITIRGADVGNCKVKANIVAQAKTEEKAQELAEQVLIELEPSKNKLITKIKKPKSLWYQSYSINVNLDITIPNETNLKLTTHNGHIEIENITGEMNSETHNGSIKISEVSGTIKLKTHNGSITCNDISGEINSRTHNGPIKISQGKEKIKLKTHNGSITCNDISGDTELKTHNGKVNVTYSKTASPICNISIVTHNGHIHLVSPPNLSAAVNVSTHGGSIKSDLPILLKGKISSHKTEGIIGKGEGKLYLKTHNGPIEIK